MVLHAFSDDWFARQRASQAKWETILDKVKKGGHFRFMDNGFPGFPVVEACGYCAEFIVGKDCGACPLFRDRFCSHSKNDGPKTVFWQFVYHMSTSMPNFVIAESLAQEMLDRIKQDRV